MKWIVHSASLLVIIWITHGFAFPNDHQRQDWRPLHRGPQHQQIQPYRMPMPNAVPMDRRQAGNFMDALSDWTEEPQFMNWNNGYMNPYVFDPYGFPPMQPPQHDFETSRKALLSVLAPLAALAVTGPLLASKMVLPLAVLTGNTAAAAVKAGRRRRRQVAGSPFVSHRQMPPPWASRLNPNVLDRQFQEIQTPDMHKEQSAYMGCTGLLDKDNHCLERLSCELYDSNSKMTDIEREMTSLVIKNILHNPEVQPIFKKQLRKAAIQGLNYGRCSVFWCQKIDNPMQAVKV